MTSLETLNITTTLTEHYEENPTNADLWNIADDSDSDIYDFTLDANSIYKFTVNNHVDSNAYLEQKEYTLYDSNDNSLLSKNTYSQSNFVIFTDSISQYFLEVTAGDDSASYGTYSIITEKVSTEELVITETSTNHYEENPTNIDLWNLSSEDDVDTYKFSLEANNYYKISVNHLDDNYFSISLFNKDAIIYNNDLIGSSDNYQTEFIIFTDQDRDYFLDVIAFDEQELGDYEIITEKITGIGDSNESFEQAVDVVLSTSSSSSDTNDTQDNATTINSLSFTKDTFKSTDDVDWYKVSLESGKSYEVDFGSNCLDLTNSFGTDIQNVNKIQKVYQDIYEAVSQDITSLHDGINNFDKDVSNTVNDIILASFDKDSFGFDEYIAVLQDLTSVINVEAKVTDTQKATLLSDMTPIKTDLDSKIDWSATDSILYSDAPSELDTILSKDYTTLTASQIMEDYKIIDKSLRVIDEWSQFNGNIYGSESVNSITSIKLSDGINEINVSSDLINIDDWGYYSVQNLDISSLNNGDLTITTVYVDKNDVEKTKVENKYNLYQEQITELSTKNR